MPSATEVTPQKWSDISVLFDDGEYSVISGVYESQGRTIGERWNRAKSPIGFPNAAGYPIWHVAPKFLHVPILHGLLDELAKNPQPDCALRIMHELETLHQQSLQLAGA